MGEYGAGREGKKEGIEEGGKGGERWRESLQMSLLSSNKRHSGNINTPIIMKRGKYFLNTQLHGVCMILSMKGIKGKEVPGGVDCEVC